MDYFVTNPSTGRTPQPRLPGDWRPRYDAVMPKRTNPFQQLVYLIQEQLRDRPDTVVTESKMLVDRNTGKKREADIVVDCTVNSAPLVIAFECRSSRSRKPTIEWVEQMLKKHEHLSDKLVLVANRAFSADAIDLARREGADTVELSAATKMDWPARIDQYTNLFVATFDFQIVTFTVVPDAPEDAPRFAGDHTIRLTDKWGKGCPVADAVESLVANHELFGRRVMELWYARPLEQRLPEHTVTVEYPPPADQPMTLSQGTLSYPLKKLVITVRAKIGAVPLAMVQAGYKGMRVMHGAATPHSGHLVGQTMRLVLTEQPGQAPKGAMMVSGAKSAEPPLVRTLQFEDPAKPVSG